MRYLKTYEGFGKPLVNDDVILDEIYQEIKKQFNGGTFKIDHCDFNYKEPYTEEEIVGYGTYYFNVFGMRVVMHYERWQNRTWDVSFKYNNRDLNVSRQKVKKIYNICVDQVKKSRIPKSNDDLLKDIEMHKELGEDANKNAKSIGLI